MIPPHLAAFKQPLQRFSMAALLVMTSSLWAGTVQAQAGELDTDEANTLTAKESPYRVSLSAELGYFGFAKHSIQFGSDGTEIDYVQDAGQSNLYPFLRASADLQLGERKQHTFILLYQPIEVNTEEVLKKDYMIDGVLFPEGTLLNSKYSFPFYRLSYLYDLKPERAVDLEVGGSFQIRNARIEFNTPDGTLRVTNRDIGPVPVLKVRYRHAYASGYWYGAEVDGFYAPIKYLNGDNDSDVVGAIWDASLRGGIRLVNGSDLFVNVRYLGGGAEGTSPDSTPPGDGYTSNWLHTVSVTLGATLR